jgi:hypothetical protein
VRQQGFQSVGQTEDQGSWSGSADTWAIF